MALLFFAVALVILFLFLGYRAGFEAGSTSRQITIDQTMVDLIRMCIELVPDGSMSVDDRGNFLCHKELNHEPFQ